MTIVEKALERLRRTAPTQTARADVTPVGSIVVGAERDASANPDFAEPVAPTRRIALDRVALREMGYLPDSSKDRQFAGYYRHIKRPLIAQALVVTPEGGPNPRLIMLASALPGDGKTFTSINLALSLARERDMSVVLVDADIPKPHVSRIFGVDEEPGLLDALGDKPLDVESLILPTDISGLSILPAGHMQEGATEMLSSDRMGAVITRLMSRNARRIVLFDSPPLLVSTESRAIAAVAGQVVLVVRSGKTPRQAVLDAIALVDGARPVSLILNQARISLSEHYYGYGKYGSYGDDQSGT